ncbi:arsenate reductase family protein [Bacillus andreraoultii]|uniref:arsenate reductase family protein n=1 Tax=Bacillus andreraoultii TaxID=1499685 RepID=UPI00053B66BA|nr:arsenate reductase family protein [Bacillus andreraoultii]
MTLTLYWHPQCQTCRKTKKWLDEKQVSYTPKHIVKSTPSREEMEDMYHKSGLGIRKFFNTHHKLYRELGIKDKLMTATENELLDILASDGRLIKKPILTDGQKVIIGFNEEEILKFLS